jgi:hypothetical protein
MLRIVSKLMNEGYAKIGPRLGVITTRFCVNFGVLARQKSRHDLEKQGPGFDRERWNNIMYEWISRHDFMGSGLYKKLYSSCFERGFTRDKLEKSKEITLRLRVFD